MVQELNVADITCYGPRFPILGLRHSAGVIRNSLQENNLGCGLAFGRYGISWNRVRLLNTILYYYVAGTPFCSLYLTHLLELDSHEASLAGESEFTVQNRFVSWWLTRG